MNTTFLPPIETELYKWLKARTAEGAVVPRIIQLPPYPPFPDLEWERSLGWEERIRAVERNYAKQVAWLEEVKRWKNEVARLVEGNGRMPAVLLGLSNAQISPPAPLDSAQ